MTTIYKITHPSLRRRGEPITDTEVYVNNLDALKDYITNVKSSFIAIHAITLYDNEDVKSMYYQP